MYYIIPLLLLIFSTDTLSNNKNVFSLIELTRALNKNGFTDNYQRHQQDGYYQAVKTYIRSEQVIIKAFVKPKTAQIKQLSLTTKRCNFSKLPKKTAWDWANREISTAFKSYFKVEIPKEFLEVKDIKKKKIDSPFTAKVRTKKVMYKCDGMEGEGRSIDLFFN